MFGRRPFERKLEIKTVCSSFRAAYLPAKAVLSAHGLLREAPTDGYFALDGIKIRRRDRTRPEAKQISG